MFSTNWDLVDTSNLIIFLKPGQKICRSCEKAIKNVIKIAPINDYHIDDMVGKNNEGDCDTLAREASKKYFKIK